MGTQSVVDADISGLRAFNPVAVGVLSFTLCRVPERYDEAVAAYAKSLEIEPTNKDIQAKYNEARC